MSQTSSTARDLSSGSREAGGSGVSPTAASRAYEYVRARLFDGTYVGGMMLSEGDIADALKISRTPVHEALLRCEFEGHLRLYPKRGALVLSVSAKEIDDVLETRRLIELYAAEKACETGRLGPDLIATVDQQAALLAEGHDSQFSASDHAFHSRIVAATGNTLLQQVYAIARDVPLKVASGNLRRDPNRATAVIDEHRAIAQAINDQDTIAGLKAVEEHLANSKKSLLRAMR